MSSSENGGPQTVGPGSSGAGGRVGPPTALKPGKKKEEKVGPPQKVKRQSLQAQQKQEQLEPSKQPQSSRTPSPQPQQQQTQQEQQQQKQQQPPQRQQQNTMQPQQSQPIQLIEPSIQTRDPKQHQQPNQRQQQQQQPQHSRSRSQPPPMPAQLQNRSRVQQKQTQLKKSKKKRDCCSCCGKKDSSKNRNIADSEAEDDASHIAALSKQQSKRNRNRQERSTGCLCCRKKTGTSANSKPSTTSAAAERRRKNCKKCCKSFLAFVFSHVGLCSLVVAYSIMGGFLFQWLESSDEIQQRMDVTKKRNNTVYKLWTMTRKLNILYEPNWTLQADEIVKEFQTEVYLSIKEGGWDGRDERNSEMQWSYSGSLLYSITVITTIGYGHIAPKTDMGRLVTMFYALVGIPLTLLCLTNIGSFFANCFRFLYQHICNCLVSLFCPKPKRRPKYHGSTSTMTTSASLKSVASKKSKSMRDMHAEFEESRQALRNKDNTDISLVEKGLHLGNGGRDGKPCRSYDEISACVDDMAVPKKKEKEEIRVPMIVSLLIVAGYIFGGAVLFSLWEDDWDYLIGSYFCFVTLSTIGFGDYVFGVGSDLANSEKMITCAIYLVLGLSIIAMCFNLMQEEVRMKCRWLGAKLGIIEPKRKPGRRL